LVGRQKNLHHGGGGVLSEGAFMLGFITQDQLDSLRTIFGFGAAATFASKINRVLPLLKN
jgi:hypothetical protein